MGTAAQRHDTAKAVRCLSKHTERIAAQVQGHAHPRRTAWARDGWSRRCTAGAAGGRLEASPSPRHRCFWLHRALGMECSHCASRSPVSRRASGHPCTGMAQSLTAWNVSPVVTSAPATIRALSSVAPEASRLQARAGAYTSGSHSRDRPWVPPVHQYPWAP